MGAGVTRCPCCQQPLREPDRSFGIDSNGKAWESPSNAPYFPPTKAGGIDLLLYMGTISKETAFKLRMAVMDERSERAMNPWSV